MITIERLQQLCEQAASIAGEVEDVDEQFRSYGLEPGAAMQLLETITSIGEAFDWPHDNQLSFALLIGVLIGRDQ